MQHATMLEQPDDINHPLHNMLASELAAGWLSVRLCSLAHHLQRESQWISAGNFLPAPRPQRG
jgi:hypothetical protein